MEFDFRKILLNFTLGFCIRGINFTCLNARTVKDETCCTSIWTEIKRGKTHGVAHRFNDILNNNSVCLHTVVQWPTHRDCRMIS